VTYAYISDAHDNHSSARAYGPGEAGYVSILKQYDDAFAKFFSRLQADGITPKNTLFVITADEGDHFVGGQPAPANCDGIHVACTYSHIGELNTNLAGLVANQTGITTPFTVHSDSAPTVYITGNPARTANVTRALERAVGNLTAVNPITNQTDLLTEFLADPVEMKLLHMVTNDTARTPTFTMFGDPDYFFFAGAKNCTSPCVTENPAFAWNHGDVQPDITTTWFGMVGPGVTNAGIDNSTWTDHTDIRPTMMMLLGLKDDYSHDGRAIVENLTGYAVPKSVKQKGTFIDLAQAYKKINAPVGQFALDTLKASTKALESGQPGNDTTYTDIENQLIALTDQRNAVASQISGLLNGAEFSGQTINQQQAHSLISQAQQLLDQAKTLAGP
jgi:arylsulfatase A-like enzyme